MSLRLRLLLAIGAVAIVALVGADLATYSALRSFLLGRVDQGLQSAQQALEVGGGTGRPTGSRGPAEPPGGSPPGGLPRGAGSSDGGPGQSALMPRRPGDLRGGTGGERFGRLRATGLPTGWTRAHAQAAGPHNGLFVAGRATGELAAYFDTPSATNGGPSFRVQACKLANGEILVLAAPLSGVAGTLGSLATIELAVTGGALVLAALLGWWLVRVGLRPLVAIERTAGAIARGELGQRVPGESPRTEVGQLAGAVNVMLGRIQGAFAARDAKEAELRRSEERMRQFVADASHELRTPLAAVSAYAELFGRGADRRPDDLARVMAGIRTEAGRMGQLVGDLMTLAHLDEGRPWNKRL